MRATVAALLLITSLFAEAAGPVVEFVTPDIVRVRWNPDGALTDNATGACVYTQGKVDVSEQLTDSGRIFNSGSLMVTVGNDGSIVFADPAGGEVLLRESFGRPRQFERVVKEKIIYDEASARMEDTANGKVTVKDEIRRDTLGTKNRYAVTFQMDAGEGLFGLGSHMEDYMNLLGKTQYLTQHNLKAFVPVLVSTRGYGLLFDAGCSMKFESVPGPTAGLFESTVSMEAANTVDYYFIKGERPADVVAGYRYLTGTVSMLPRYIFGYVQSRERYVSSDDIVSTLREYRRRRVPIDVIVQDWNYWPQGWGYMKMNRDYYPDPAALADSVHALDARIMISIWGNPQYCPEADDFRNRGFMLEHSVYDAFNPEARDLYWDYADKEFFSNGFDAWWCDSSEPLDGDWNRLPDPVDGRPYCWDDHERRWHLNDDILSEALGAERACLYSLNHAKGIYEHQRAATDRKRVVNLTRSTFAGQQRYATIVWNGDTYASWESFRRQIPAGLNYMATGNPYWTVDVGGFFTSPGPQWFHQGEFPRGVADEAYREYYTRMFEWATFLPILRSHGTDTPREIWQFGEPGTPYYDAIHGLIRLRYSLMPYIYSMAAAQSAGDYTMARPLAFDYPNDPAVFDIKDQYMFGDIMVCPVTSPGVESREVYLPAGSVWYDFRTREKFTGRTEAPAPLGGLPLFVRGGSIILLTEPLETADASIGAPVTVDIFPGADAEFTFYEDSGDSYDFEKGQCVRIPMRWNDEKRILTIDEAIGNYENSPEMRKFTLRMGDSVQNVNYNGKRKVVKF